MKTFIQNTSKIFLILILFLFLNLFDNLDTVSAVSQTTKADVKATRDLLQTKKTTSTEKNTSSLTLIFVVIGSIVGVGAIGIIVIYFFNKEKRAAIAFRDQKRKHDLEKIRYSLSAFAKTYGRYPNAERGEFLDLLKQMESFPIDPLVDKDIGFNNQKYNYYYDNQSLNLKEKGRSNTSYYRLWCHLENSSDIDINKLYVKNYKNIYLKTSSDPLNPAFLQEPQKENQKNTGLKSQPEISVPMKPTISNVEVAEIDNHRKESVIRFLLIITTFGLIVSAIINGILYYMVQTK